MIYPFAIVPFTYVTSFAFSKESTAQNVTIFSHLIIGSILASAVFMMRMMQDIEDQGDTLNNVFKVFPSYALSSGMLYSSSKAMLNESREYKAEDLVKGQHNTKTTNLLEL